MNEIVKQEEVIDPETGEIMNQQSQFVASLRGNVPQVEENVFDLLDKYQGAGYSSLAEDGLTPVLSILQDNSGEVKKQHERHMQGAESGMLIIRSLRKLFSGGAGIAVQPFGFNHVYVEWSGAPGEGVPVGRFPFAEPPPDTFETKDPQNPERTVLRRKSTMNRLVDTREHYVNVFGDTSERPYPIVVPMAGSNHSVSRLWTNMMRNMVYDGKKLPSFFRFYGLKTVFRKKGTNQTWYGYQIDPGALIKNREVLEFGALAFESMKEKPIEANLSDMAGGDVDDVAATAYAPATGASQVNVSDVI